MSLYCEMRSRQFSYNSEERQVCGWLTEAHIYRGVGKRKTWERRGSLWACAEQEIYKVGELEDNNVRLLLVYNPRRQGERHLGKFPHPTRPHSTGARAGIREL